MTDFDMVAIHQVGSQAEDGTPYSETQDNRAIASDASEDKKEQEEVEEVEEDLENPLVTVEEKDQKNMVSAVHEASAVTNEVEAQLELDRLLIQEELLRIQLRRTEVELLIARNQKGVNSPSKREKTEVISKKFDVSRGLQEGKSGHKSDLQDRSGLMNDSSGSVYKSSGYSSGNRPVSSKKVLIEVLNDDVLSAERIPPHQETPSLPGQDKDTGKCSYRDGEEKNSEAAVGHGVVPILRTLQEGSVVNAGAEVCHEKNLCPDKMDKKSASSGSASLKKQEDDQSSNNLIRASTGDSEEEKANSMMIQMYNMLASKMGYEPWMVQLDGNVTMEKAKTLGVPMETPAVGKALKFTTTPYAAVAALYSASER